MKTEKFESILNKRIDKCVKVLCAKADEYATEDRLHNFKVAAELQNCTPITALAGMMAKHTVSVYDLIKRQEQGLVVPKEMWDEKIGDHLNYLFLLTALIEEKSEEGTEDAPCSGMSETDMEGLKAYIENELKTWKAVSDKFKGSDVVDCYDEGYKYGKCAGASEVAKTVSLYLSGGDK